MQMNDKIEQIIEQNEEQIIEQLEEVNKERLDIISSEYNAIEVNSKIEELEDELEESELITIEIEKEFVLNTGNYSNIKQRYGIKREGRTKNITAFLQQTDDIISKKVNEQFNKIKASL